jgi:hypothetical protein
MISRTMRAMLPRVSMLLAAADAVLLVSWSTNPVKIHSEYMAVLHLSAGIVDKI